MEDGPLSPHDRVFQRAVIVATRGNLLSHPGLDLGHSGLF